MSEGGLEVPDKRGALFPAGYLALLGCHAATVLAPTRGGLRQRGVGQFAQLVVGVGVCVQARAQESTWSTRTDCAAVSILESLP